MITHAQLLELLRYEPETGQFIWLAGKRAGTSAGRPTKPEAYADRNGRRLPYWMISLLGKPYSRGKLAWFYMTGEWPPDQIDHRDIDSLNDRWNNLRPATQALNN